MKITRKNLEKLIIKELESADIGSSFKPSGSMATLRALLPRHDMEGGAMSRGDRVERRKEIVLTLKKMVGDNAKEAKEKMAAAMKRQRDNMPLLSDNIQADLLRAFFNNGRASFFQPEGMQESKNINKNLDKLIKEEVEALLKEQKMRVEGDEAAIRELIRRVADGANRGAIRDRQISKLFAAVGQLTIGELDAAADELDRDF